MRRGDGNLDKRVIVGDEVLLGNDKIYIGSESMEEKLYV